MDTQTFINICIAITSGALGYVVNDLKKSMDNLRASDDHLATKVQSIEVLVAGSYVKWDGLKDALAPLLTQLNRIENKLDGKVDK